MKPLVIDANVAAKWFLPDESLVDEAFDLLRRHGKGEVQFVVPDLFWAELGNIFWKAVRLKRSTRLAAEVRMREMIERGLPTVPSGTLMQRALSIALTFDRTVYDSLYVALATESNGQLVTADERLANALAAHLPVKWLGAWS